MRSETVALAMLSCPDQARACFPFPAKALTEYPLPRPLPPSLLRVNVQFSLEALIIQADLIGFLYLTLQSLAET